jgi:arylsulfatase A-like enzyme
VHDVGLKRLTEPRQSTPGGMSSRNPTRGSFGLPDFADILPTALSLAGVPGAQLASHFPKTTYIDGVDQASFLVADNGQSARRSRPYTLNHSISP